MSITLKMPNGDRRSSPIRICDPFSQSIDDLKSMPDARSKRARGIAGMAWLQIELACGSWAGSAPFQGYAKIMLDRILRGLTNPESRWQE